MTKKIIFTKEQEKEIVSLYCDKLINYDDIGKIFNCSPEPIYRILKENKVIINNHKRYKLLLEKGKLVVPNKRLDLRENYVEIINLYNEGVNIKEIGEKFGCSSEPIWDILKENNVAMSQSKRRKLLSDIGKIKYQKRQDVWDRFEEIKHFYMDEFMNTKEIANIIGCNYNLIKAVLTKNGICMGTSERRRYLADNGKLNIWNRGLTKEDDERVKSGIEKMTKWKQENIAGKTYIEIFGEERAKDIIERKNISGSIAKMGEKNPSYGKKGESAFAWVNGNSFSPYPSTFNNSFKLLIRQRDGFQCLKCGMFEEDHIKLFGRKLIIHHIDYVRDNTFPENCCVLCNRCNLEVNNNRDIWKVHFQSLLSKLYGYQYSSEGDIILNLNKEMEIKDNTKKYP